MVEKIRLEDRECPLSSTLGLVGEWWTLLILHDAFDGFTRFDQFQENLAISSSLLTSRLKRLVDCGLLEDATRAETADLLGEGGGPGDTSWSYTTRPTMIDFELLVVDFGPDDTVTRIYFSQS